MKTYYFNYTLTSQQKQSGIRRCVSPHTDCVCLHFIHLYVLLVLGKLEVGVIGRWSELVARQHEKDQSRHLHQKLKEQRGVEGR